MVCSLVGLGDIHTRNKPFYRYGFKEFLKWLDQKFPDESKETTEFFLAGDILNKVSMVPPTSADLIELDKVLKRKARTIYVILGNHDYGLTNYKVVSAEELLVSLGWVVITENQVLTTGLGFKVLCLPWQPSVSFAALNEYVESLKGTQFDAFVSHWDLDFSFSEDSFIKTQEVQTLAFMGGHIHSHKWNNKYLGSILPNSSAENKEQDRSVVRVVIKDFETNKHKVVDLEIPSFVRLPKVYIKDLSELDSLEKSPDIFYKFISNILNLKIEAKKRGLQVYKIEKEDFESKLQSEDEENPTQEIDGFNYTLYNHKQLLDLYAEELKLNNLVKSLAAQAISMSE